MKALRRTSMALVSTMGLLVVLIYPTSPASAAGTSTHRWEIATGGTLTIAKGTAAADISLGGGTGTPSCPKGTAVAEANLTPTPNTLKLTGLTNTSHFTLTTGTTTTTYIAELTLTGTGVVPGTLVSSTTPHVITDVPVPVRLEFFEFSSGSCTKGARLCGFTTTLVVSGTSTSLSDSHSVTLTAPAVALAADGAARSPSPPTPFPRLSD